MNYKISSIQYDNFSNNCKVILDNEQIIQISTDIVLKYQISKEMEISDEFISILINKQRIIDVKQSAYKIATYRLQPESKIKQKLKEKDFSIEEIEIAINFLNEFKLIDDARFIKSYIKDRLLKKAISSQKLKFELIEMGLDKYLIEDVLAESMDKEDEYFQAKKAAEKKLRLIANKPLQKQKQSLFTYLASLGFKNDIITDIIKENFNDAND